MIPQIPLEYLDRQEAARHALREYIAENGGPQDVELLRRIGIFQDAVRASTLAYIDEIIEPLRERLY